MLILKHLFDWSYDDLEREVRANLVYRMFTRIDAGDVPDAKTILKIARALGPEVIEQLHRQVIEVAKRAGVTHGRRFRIDTTVVETNVHYPTDSTLLQDGVRVLTRTMQRASTALGDPPGRIRNRLRSVTRRVLIIGYEARSPKTRDAMVKSYRKLMATTRAVLRDTATMVRRLGQRVRTASPQVQPMLQRAQDRLQADAAARAAGRRPNAGARPGRRYPRPRQSPERLRTAHRDDSQRQDREAERVRQAGHHSRSRNIRSSRRTTSTRSDRPTSPCGPPALDRHQTIFGRAPDLAAGDRGFSSATNEQAATDRGVRRVVLPRRGPKSPARRAYERQRWFRRGQRWRVGCEGRISVLKRRHGLDRCRYHGDDGMHRWVGFGVIANNLVNTATFSKARAAA